jgi:hypothetical protein
MTAATAFAIANPVALLGWALLAVGVLLRRPLLRDRIAGQIVPGLFAAAYVLILLLAMPGAEGGFGSLDDVARLFASPWLLLAGWLHYLAFDLFIGAWIARQTERQGLPRWLLIPILPLTFLFGPAGLLAFLIVTLARGASRAHAAA